MELKVFADAEQFLDLAGDDLRRQEVVNNLILGVATQLAEQPPLWLTGEPYFAAVYGSQGFSAAGMHTPPFGLVLAVGGNQPEEGVAVIARNLMRRGRSLPDVNGPKPYPFIFSRLWTKLGGGSIRLEMAQRAYELREVEKPSEVEGVFRAADEKDVALLANWMTAFSGEVFGEDTEPAKMAEMSRAYIDDGSCYLWQSEGKIVSMAIRTYTTERGATISYVYTPPDERRKGYASAVVAELSQKCLNDGYAFCMLFTDLSNPTSNEIYMRIGYKTVMDFDKYKLSR